MKHPRRSLAIFLVVTLSLLLILHLVSRTQNIDNPEYWELVGLFDMDSEISLATWYSTVVLLFIPAVLLFYVGWQKRRSQQKPSWPWFVLSGLFLFMSIDDAAMIHEKFSTLNRLSGLQDVLSGVNSSLLAWSWWVIYLPIVAILAIILLRWYFSLPKRTMLLIAVAVCLAVAGQVGMEMISSFVSNDSGEYIGPIWRGLQKFVGRLGLSLFLFAIVDYILSDTGLIRVKCQAPQSIQR
jgi:hypothetical protein